MDEAAEDDTQLSSVLSVSAADLQAIKNPPAQETRKSFKVLKMKI